MWQENFCVQYQETDLNFVMRLLAEDGIYFYIRHDEGGAVVVFTDDKSHHATRVDAEFNPSSGGDLSGFVRSFGVSAAGGV